MVNTELWKILTLPENLFWAWRKVREHLRYTDMWFDEIELARFELEVKNELETISKQFRRYRYNMTPLRPLPIPKKKEEDGKASVRQAFWVAIRDQVAWTALVDVIGSYLERHMPAWSYGNRLYQSIERSEEGKNIIIRVGPWRNTQSLLYRKFQHSWPLYRRHIYLTVRQMSSKQLRDELPLSDVESRELEVQQKRHDLPIGLRLPYLQEGYWHTRGIRKVFWAAIDLEKFYLKINLNNIIENVVNHLQHWESELTQLLNDMLRFPLNLDGFSADELLGLDLEKGQAIYQHIPTNLYVSGFLANVAMLKVDKQVQKEVKEAQVAHFRYVDDHVILAKRYADLLSWIDNYKRILIKHRVGVAYNLDKFEPNELKNYMVLRSENETTKIHEAKKKAEFECELDVRYPTPLMTQTLAKVSQIAQIEFDLLDENEQVKLIEDLEHLLVTPFPDTELRADTRVSFAATKLAALAARRFHSIIQESDIARERYKNAKDISLLTKDIDENGLEGFDSVKKEKELEGQEKAIRAERESSYIKEMHNIWSLMFKAIQEHPYKLRLWNRAVTFCRHTGTKKIKVLWEFLDEYSKKNLLGFTFLRSLVMQTISFNVLCCLSIIKSKGMYPPKQNAALLFLDDVVSFCISLGTMKDNLHYYEANAYYRLKAAIGTALFQIRKSFENIQNPIAQLVNKLYFRLSYARAIDWDRQPFQWIKETGHPAAAWIWWAEQWSVTYDSLEPSPLWLKVIEQLDSSNLLNVLLAQRYPEWTPEWFCKFISVEKNLKKQPSPGLIYEMFMSIPQESPKRKIVETSSINPVRIVREVLQAPANMISLWEWVDWSADRAKEIAASRDFDPRTSEWTALEIIRQICEVLLQDMFKGKRLPRSYHPGQFFIPKTWIESELNEATWEKWNSIVRQEKRRKIRIRRRPVILDDRFTPIWALNPNRDTEWAPIRGLALLLLGLLRRNFRWPARWNTPGQARAWEWLALSEISKIACSSWTAAILEACLKPRARENFLLPLFGQELRDTVEEPPEILEIYDLKKYLDIAQLHLKKHQITVHAHRPRQLIPLRLGQLNRDIWSKEIAEEEVSL